MPLLYDYPIKNVTGAIACISTFINICTIHKVFYCFIFGTALGLYRDHNFIKTDNDIDVFAKFDRNPGSRFLSDIKNSGFAVNTIPGSICNHNYHLLRNRTLLDVWFKTHDNFSKNFDSLTYVTFHNLQIPLPCNIENYLSLVYGDWKTPNKHQANVFKGIPADQIYKEKELKK